jgi:thiamine biosynthesis lipoprotein
MNEHRFRAMGCDVVVSGAGPRERATIERLFAERDHIFSRFVADSELNRVNAVAGRPVLVSGAFADALRAALRAVEETDGMVDPTLGGALAAAGYTRDTDELDPDPRPPGPAAGPGPVAVMGRVVRTAPAVELDLNGVVKAMAVDDALALLPAAGWVSAGGDLATRGPVTVELPGGDAVELRSGALATSGRSKRWWLRAGERQHHLIDARTGRPAITPWTDVTACGATCLAADIAAKAGFLLGEDGPSWLAARGIPARFVTEGGDVVANEAWAYSMREAVACT